MKKVLSFFSFAVLVTAMCVMSGCKDDDKDDDKGGSSNAKALVGRWMQMQSRGADKTEWSDWPSSVTATFQYDADGTYHTYLGGVELMTGTYKVEGKKIIITFSDNSTQTYELREMSKDKNSMEELLYKSDGTTPDVYYRMSRCPKDAAEAKQMLMAQWKYDAPEDYYDESYSYDADYYDFSKEGKDYYFCHYKKDLPSNHPYYEYRGKYICWDDNIYDLKIIPDNTDPTKGQLYDGATWTYSRLCYQSVNLWSDDWPCIRVEKPITYEILEMPE